jgi:hypothetical protein
MTATRQGCFAPHPKKKAQTVNLGLLHLNIVGGV